MWNGHTIRVDPEFRSLIPPLKDEERAGLEASLRREGCRDALVTWHGWILDGHHRYEICVGLLIPVRTVEAKFNTRIDAMQWIIRNQFGRRNLTPYQRAELALKLEPLIAAKAKEQQRSHGNTAPGRGKALLQNSVEVKTNTQQELAKTAQLSHDTIHRAKTIAEKAPESVKERLRRGETTINREYRRVQQAERRRAQRAVSWMARCSGD